MDAQADKRDNSTDELHLSDIVHDSLDDNAETKTLMTGNVHIPFQTKDENEPIPESGSKDFIKHCTSCNQQKRFLIESSLSCNELICTDCQNENIGAAIICDEKKRLFDTINNHDTTDVLIPLIGVDRGKTLNELSQTIDSINTEVKGQQKMCEPCTKNAKKSIACHFCATCENEFLCEACSKHHTLQKSTRSHKLQDISKYVNDTNTNVIGIKKLCEPCTANEKSISAYFFCAECENEFLCDSCGKHHNIQKLTRLHKLQGINQYVEAAYPDITHNQQLCEPCTANEKSVSACYFCAECENEFLCETCGKHHKIQKSTRTHKLQDISEYIEALNANVTNNQKFCEPCTANEKSIPACYFCAECENEFLCEPCGKHHALQKSTKRHKIQDIRQYVVVANADIIKNKKLCELCTANDKSIPASYFCADCENEFLCETCGKHHNIQKSTKKHKLQDISQYLDVPNSEIITKLLLCELCTPNDKSSPACYFCPECENEFLCETCSKLHKIQKSTRTHKLQDIGHYVEVQNSDIINKQFSCELCTANELSSRACFFCAECENEFLCETCGKHHNIQKSTRTHKLQDVSQYLETAKHKITDTQKMCKYCAAHGKSSPACFICTECDNEFLCEACGKRHNIQKSTHSHKLQTTTLYERASIESDQRKFICDPCKEQNKYIFAAWFCAECENEMLCEECAIYHKANKLFQEHALQNINSFEEADFTGKYMDFCEPCSVLKKLYPAVYVCAACKNEKLCDKCAKYHTLQKSFRKHVLQIIDGPHDAAARSSDSIDSESTPGQPTAINVGSDNITLTWEKPSLFQAGAYFQIVCREYKETKWKICYNNVETNIFELHNVKSDAQFVFRIRAVYNDFESNYSKESEIVTTKKSPASHIVKFATIRSVANTIPAHYALPMNEVKTARNIKGKTRKFEIGSPGKLNWKERTVLLIGETGTGKSTLVDGMANYILGVNWNDEFRFTIISLEDEERQKQANQAVSQTEWITCYTMHPQDGGRLQYTVHIIDTPGFGDTRGIQQDQEIVDHIRQLFTTKPPMGISAIDAVCFLIKAPDARLTPSQSYIFQAIMSLFGKDIEKNICSLITFADGLNPPVRAALEESGLTFGKWFTFNNAALFANNTDLDSSSLSPMFWDMGLKSFRDFFSHVETQTTQSLQMTGDVLNERHRLEAIVRNIEPLLDAGLLKINTLNETIAICEQNKSIISDNKSFTYTVKTTKHLKKDLPAGQHVTNCTECSFTCHEKCTIPKDEDKRKCWAIDNTSGKCKICPKYCMWDKHHNTPYIFEYIVVDEVQTYAEMKQKYEDASGKLLNQEQLIAEIKADLNQLIESVDEMMETYYASRACIAEIALHPNPLSIKEHIDLLIEHEQNLHKNGWLERIKALELIRKRADIDGSVNRFLMQATTHVAFERKNTRFKNKKKPGKWNSFSFSRFVKQIRK